MRKRGFEEFAQARTPALYRAAWLLCGDRQVAEDLVQETLVKVYLKWSRIENPAAYAQTTLARTFISRQRRRSNHEVPYSDLSDVVDSTVTSGSASSSAIVAIELRVDLQRLLSDLAPLDRAVLVLRYHDGLPAEEVATRLNLTTAAVRNRSMRALQKARERSTP